MSLPSERRPSSPRRYPLLYERLVPLALALIGVAVLAMLLITVGIVLGLL
jgi:hypothetical protein